MLGGQTLCLTDVLDLILLTRPWVKPPAQEEPGHHTAQAPHFNSLAEWQAWDYLRGTVVSGLEVGVTHCLAHMAGQPKVNHFHPVILIKSKTTSINSYIIMLCQETRVIFYESLTRAQTCHKADVGLASEAPEGQHKIKFVHIFLAESGQYGHLYLPLSHITQTVLQDLDHYNPIHPLLPALGHLAESPSAQELEDLILVVEGGVEHLMLHQLVLPITARTPPPPPPLPLPPV